MTAPPVVRRREAPRQFDSRLEAARAVGVAALCILGQFAVSMPGGYFGASEESTAFGVIFSAVVAAMAPVLGLAHLHRRPWAPGLGLLFYAACLGVFIPTLATDPVRSVPLVAWLLLAITRALFPIAPDELRLLQAEDAIAAARRAWGPASTHLAFVALGVNTTVVGFELSARPGAFGVVFGLGLLALLAATPYLRALLRAGSRLVVVVPALLAVALALLIADRLVAALAVLGVTNLIALGVVVAREALTADLTRAFYEQPAMLVCVTFVALITLGAVLLSFPAASASGVSVSPVDALFTATSAACVTGLTTIDTGTSWSFAGQVVILTLIQAGGLNIMVLSTVAALALGRRLGLRGEAALAQVLDLPQQRSSYQVTVFIVQATLVIEGVGALALLPSFLSLDQAPVDALWSAVFHSVSAFCNAGFGLRPDSLVCFERDPFALIVVSTLITLGGLGFTVLASAWALLRRKHPRPVPLQVRLVVLISAVLTLGGAAWWLVVEWEASLRGLEPGHKVVNALFQSVVLRTAGFNSVDLMQVTRPTIVVMVVLMFIGASPGGTGGGVKTTTFGVLLGAVIAAARGGAPIVLFGREVPWSLVYRSAAVLMVSFAIAALGLLALLGTQRALGFEHLVFEVSSALATVGLTLGVTPVLDAWGKLIVMALMFAGRVGPLTLVLLFGSAAAGRIRHPEAKLMIG